MARKETVEIEGKINEEELKKKFQNLTDSVDKLNSNVEKLGDKGKESMEKVEKQSKGANKAVRGVGKGFNYLGAAMKSAGIGIVIGAVSKLTEIFMSNQKVMDQVNVVMQTLTGFFGQVTDAIVSAVESTNEASGGFDAMTKVIKNLLTLGLTPLMGGFNLLKLGLYEAQLAWEKSFFGDGDQKTIDSLNEKIGETQDNLKEIADDAKESAKAVSNNFSEAMDELGTFTESAVNNLSKVSVTAAHEQAKSLVEVEKNAKLAAAEIRSIISQKEREAEVQRQIRDDIRLSIEERIRANDKLGEILDEQLKKERQLAQVKAEAARIAMEANTENVDLQIAYKDALSEVEAVEEKITGKRSEQMTNEAQLQQERIDNMEQIRKIGMSEEKRAEQELQDELDRQKQLIERTVENEDERLRLIRVAEQEHEEKLNELREEVKQKREEKRIEELELDKEIEAEKFEERRSLLLQRMQILQNDEILSAEEKAKRIKEIEGQLTEVKNEEEKKQLEYKKSVEKAKMGLMQSGLALAAEIFGKGSKMAKIVAIAQTTFKAYEGVQNAFTTASASPYAVLNPSYPFIQAGVAGAFGALQVAKVASSSEPTISKNGETSGGRGGSINAGTAAGMQSQAPSFNLVGDTATNQIAQNTNPEDREPIQAYVVNRQMKDRDELDRNIERNSSL